ncbi:MAG TPA: DEAD/DEAH box helicase [Bacteroidia bacterium]|nr:DEAD/DEAH box helicase [Bacteroidia bacterium]
MKQYAEQINSLKNPTFQQIRGVALNSISHLPKPERDKLWEKLNHGVELLDSHELLCQYLFSFGNMHEAKLRDAVKYLPNEILHNDFEIIDWGCGQGIGTVCLFDHINSLGLNINVKRITLIEPSQEALERAALHVNSYFKNAKLISTYANFFDKVQDENIKSKKGLPVIHIFSNILDVKVIDLKELATKIGKAVVNDNYIISLGPLNPNNKRIDAFYNYYNAPILYNYENSQYDYGGRSTCTYKAKVFKLEYNKQGNLIPIEFYPSVQFHAAYKLDCVNYEFKEHNQTKSVFNELKVFDTSTPFDIGANVYDDIHPIIAVLNNIITRGLPTKASPFIEEVFQKSFNYSLNEDKYGTFSYPSAKNIDCEKVFSWYKSIITKQKPLNYSEIEVNHLQIIFSPIAIARIQKTILEALMTDKLDIRSKEWKILVEEKDIPCSALAFADLSEMFNKLTKLSKDYQDLVFPEIKLDIISNKTFIDSGLHLSNKNIFSEAHPKLFSIEYDLVIDIAVFETSNIEKESFSKFLSKNNCYFNNRSVTNVISARNIYTTDRIVYRNVVNETQRGRYIEIDETRELLKYFLRLIFRKDNFRAGQLPILNRALQNKSVIGLLPTGGGKSLTYQLAAMLQPGVTLIVDPLRSLMKDQYDSLINAGIDTCAYINSSKSSEENNDSQKRMEESKLQFVFLSPERLAIYKFREKLKNMNNLNVYFSYGVIDEVHCVSEWGHDFRFSYLHLGRNIYNYVPAKNGQVSLFGLTATASFDVLADVERELSGNGAFKLDAETIVRFENSNRLELQYKIEKIEVEFLNEIEALKKSQYATPAQIAAIENRYQSLLNNKLPIPIKISDKWAFFEAKRNFLKEYIKVIPNYLSEIQSSNSIQNIRNAFIARQGNNEGIVTELKTNISKNYYSKNSEYHQAGIVFCPHKNNTGISVNENKESLKKLIPDIGTFSGGDEEEEADNSMENLELFRKNKQPIMVATKAFGMGIDKPNVRFTVNLNYSSSLESFVQEAGRAGRDRKIALSVILLSDYKLARIKSNYPNITFPLSLIKGRWFKPNDLQQIILHYNLNVDEQFIDYLTPENDLVRLFCKEGTNPKYFNFNTCDDTACGSFTKCQLRRVPKEAENWVYKKDLIEILDSNKIKMDKKYIEYQNADYETVMYFYNNSFKGEVIEKQSMNEILRIAKTDVFFGDETETKFNETITVDGFLTTLIKSNIGDEIVSFVKYIKPDPKNGIEGTDTDLAKAIYRMTCIELIEDFTQDYSNSRYRIVCKRKKEGTYYEGLERFLLRYYSENRAKEEIQNVFNINVVSNSNLEKEIFQCLSYLTTFVYDKISVKRKRAIDDMRNFCITGANDSKDWKDTNEDLKDFIFYYFNSKYARLDYKTIDDIAYSLTNDTIEGKESNQEILLKYLKIIDNDFLINKSEPGSTPIDNVKHLQGAVRLLRRSLTDSNPTLSLLNSFCIFFLGTNANENLERELIESYKEGMLGFAERENNLANFWHIFNKYNLLLKPFSSGKLDELMEEITVKIHHNKFKKITSKYLA